MKTINYYLGITTEWRMARAILLALAAEREELIKRSGSLRFDPELSPDQRAWQAHIYSQRENIKEEADLLIDAASMGEISHRVEGLCERLLKTRKEYNLLPSWVQEKVLRWIM